MKRSSALNLTGEILQWGRLLAQYRVIYEAFSRPRVSFEFHRRSTSSSACPTVSTPPWLGQLKGNATAPQSTPGLFSAPKNVTSSSILIRRDENIVDDTKPYCMGEELNCMEVTSVSFIRLVLLKYLCLFFLGSNQILGKQRK